MKEDVEEGRGGGDGHIYIHVPLTEDGGQAMQLHQWFNFGVNLSSSPGCREESRDSGQDSGGRDGGRDIGGGWLGGRFVRCFLAHVGKSRVCRVVLY